MVKRLGVRHKAGDPSRAVANPGDIFQRTVRVIGKLACGEGAFGLRVTQEYLPARVKLFYNAGFCEKLSLAVPDRQFDSLHAGGKNAMGCAIYREVHPLVAKPSAVVCY